ncbi:hypothetical protein [Salinibaculum salinum]|uniref:hypothetical protein n=1 Tax=Salinibaculum salinum TaxID=3131996 RepID=UPI0030ED4BEB
MTESSGYSQQFEGTIDRELAGLLVVALLIASFGIGYATRSVLAGEQLTQQFWLVPVLLGALTPLVVALGTDGEQQ